MTDAPEHIWAKIHGASTDVMSGQRGLLGAWHEIQREGHTAYVRADLIEALEAENQRLREALESCPPTSNPTVTADYHLERINAWWENIARAALRSTREGG